MGDFPYQEKVPGQFGHRSLPLLCCSVNSHEMLRCGEDWRVLQLIILNRSAPLIANFKNKITDYLRCRKRFWALYANSKTGSAATRSEIRSTSSVLNKLSVPCDQHESKLASLFSFGGDSQIPWWLSRLLKTFSRIGTILLVCNRTVQSDLKLSLLQVSVMSLTRLPIPVNLLPM